MLPQSIGFNSNLKQFQFYWVCEIAVFEVMEKYTETYGKCTANCEP